MTEYSYTLQKISMLEKNIIQIKHQSAAYTCGCGKKFNKNHLFKDHILSFHNSYTFEGSSHFITKFTEIVLPVLNEQPLHLQQNNALKTKKIDNQIASQMPDNIETKKRKQRKIRQRRRSQVQTIDNKEQQYLEQTLQEYNQTQQQDQNERNNHYQWNGFRLVKNRSCSKGQFYCGKCQTTFSQMPQFIIHCIQNCQQLKCVDSSHFIECIVDSKIKGKSQRSLSTIADKLCRGVSYEEIGITLENYFSQLARLSIDHSKLQQFFCYQCNKKYSGSRSYLHHVIAHGEIVHNLSSHIIIRTKKVFSEKKYHAVNSYISSSIPWYNECSNYYCPCNIDCKMNMQKLIQHIKTVHMGISPFYIFMPARQ